MLQTGGCLVVVLEESGVGVEILLGAFVEHQVDSRYVQARTELSSLGTLDAVVRPEDRLITVNLDGGSRLLVVLGCEGDMSPGVPILRGDHEGKGRHQVVDDRDYLVSPFDRKSPAGTEVVLNVDYDECRILRHDIAHWVLLYAPNLSSRRALASARGIISVAGSRGPRPPGRQSLSPKAVTPSGLQ